MVVLSDNSDQPCQQLEIWNRFNPQEISNFPTLSFPFFCHYSIPFFLTHPAQFGFKVGATLVIRVTIFIQIYSISKTWLISRSSLAFWVISLSSNTFNTKLNCNKTKLPLSCLQKSHAKSLHDQLTKYSRFFFVKLNYNFSIHTIELNNQFCHVYTILLATF